MAPDAGRGCRASRRGGCITEHPVRHSEAFRGSGPRRLTAATATALSAQPDAPTESTLARSVASPQTASTPSTCSRRSATGWDSLTTGPPEAAARLVEAGFAPVAMVDLGRGRKHAVTVTGAERSPHDGTRTTALARLQTIDPRDGPRAGRPRSTSPRASGPSSCGGLPPG